jgi:hypothetical protein
MLSVITLNIVMTFRSFERDWISQKLNPTHAWTLHCICEKVGDAAAAATSFLVIYKVSRILMRRLSPLDWDTCQIFSSRKQTLSDHRYKTFCGRNL